ncbi:MAG: nucleoside hydrolase [Deltaproteobacteria bacterium]|nr:nucleoside hydrolase [Deltaproteobacteria bacterium]
MKKKVIIDCDVGVDDALALILAFHSPELEVKAITGVNGNVPLDLVFINIQKVLSLIRPGQRPLIARGADRPLKGKPVYAHSFHGADGLGGAKIDRGEGGGWGQIFPGPAHELITGIARQHPGELTLMAIGPLTNIALGLQKDPEGMRKLKEVVIMGGAVRTKGNITPRAEFNIFVDPLAAQMVFEAGLPITLAPLDVTHQVFLNPQLLEERVRPINNSISRFVIDSLGYDLARHRFRQGREKFHLHDPLTVGVVINPALVEKEKIAIQVETQEGECWGKIIEISGDQKVEVCFKVDSPKFLELFLSRLED